MTTYCGNNALYPGLIRGTHYMGTRYDCFRKGIGRGRRLPYDVNYEGPYAPIDLTRVFCGNGAVVPAGYTRLGSSTECIQKGIAIGKRMRIGEGRPFFSKRRIWLIVFVILSVALFLGYYYGKPSIVTQTDNEDAIDWEKFSLVYSISVVSVGIICLILSHFSLYF